MESKCFRVTVVPYRRGTDWHIRSTGHQDSVSAAAGPGQPPGAQNAPAAPPCFTAHVGSQLTAWENLEDCMPTGKIKMFDEGRGFGFIKSDDGGVDVFFHVSALRDGNEIAQGKAVKFEIGVDPKSGKTKAVSVDLT
jgi:CspA family cold shock protein